MATILFNVVALLSIVLVIYIVRVCGTTIKLRKAGFVVLFVFMMLGHFALCLMDSRDLYSNWINFLFFMIIIRFFWQTHQAKHNKYRLNMTWHNVAFSGFFSIAYIILGHLILNTY